MATLQEIVQQHLSSTGQSVRSLAAEAGLGYQIVLGVVNRGSLPRKAEHRDALRRVLTVDEEDWAHIIMDSATSGAPKQAEGETATLQQLVSREMYARGLTEQELAKIAGVAYSTVMGITRKGSIPRTDSLRRLTQALSLDESKVKAAAALSRATRRNPEVSALSDDEEEDERNLAQMVADLIQTRGQSIGAFAKDLGIGYLTLARFLESGKPPEDDEAREALRRMLDIDEELFEAALARSSDIPTGALFAPKDDLLGIDANPLQRALVTYMRDNSMTLKALAKKADLSQVTVSRLVKQGQSPTRATTHLKLQELLGLGPDQYQSLTLGSVKVPTSAALTAIGADEDDDEDDEDSYEPQAIEMESLEDSIEQLSFDSDKPPSRDELVALVKRLGPKQRDTLRKFLSTLV
ncbi:MAG: hypothetical protein PF961_01025 [Planctomycetota bacterium]|jgi:transcriptional regulator with XRE-family HTH domain|nr:hypothetical protein [Planctomycetota bacterium]